MKLKISDGFKNKITAMAVQAIIQKKFQKLVEDRMAEIEEELLSTDDELSPDDIIQKYGIVNPAAGIAVPNQGILIPKH